MYIEYVQEHYSAGIIAEILRAISVIIKAEVLAESSRNYEPWGASSLMLLSDVVGGEDVCFHLDKSHVCAHTYPDFRSKGRICTFRLDIELSTCGEIGPLNALNYLLQSFYSDVVVIDYKVRGFTRNADDHRIFIDHKINSIRDYIEDEILEDYSCVDIGIESENIWQTKMLRTNIEEGEYFPTEVDIRDPQVQKYLELVKREMNGIVHMWAPK
jgi:S-adenosylmethionine decarboxylase